MTVQNVINTTSSAIINSGLSAGLGYLCARIFTTINPINAAVYGAIYPIVSAITKPLFAVIFQGKDANDASRLVGEVLNVVTSVGASYRIVKALGYPLTLRSIATLTIIPVVLGIAITATFSFFVKTDTKFHANVNVSKT